MEEEIIQPIDKALLKRELSTERQLRMTNKSHNEIYIVTAHEAPNVMKEIGRLREIAFRSAGGGTGKAMDIDNFDTMENGCKQLIVWNIRTFGPIPRASLPLTTCGMGSVHSLSSTLSASISSAK